MNYATIKNWDIANGPGVRVSLFVSGCTHRCKGCFNQEAWDFQYGDPFTQETIDQILDMLAPSYVSGLTVLGGEPLEQDNQIAVLDLLRQVKNKYPDKSIWFFSGYVFDKHIMPCKFVCSEITKELLSYIDVIVDGPFIEEKKNLMLRFRGSSNQRIIDVKKSLGSNMVVLWEDWQGNRGGTV